MDKLAVSLAQLPVHTLLGIGPELCVQVDALAAPQCPARSSEEADEQQSISSVEAPTMQTNGNLNAPLNNVVQPPTASAQSGSDASASCEQHVELGQILSLLKVDSTEADRAGQAAGLVYEPHRQTELVAGADSEPEQNDAELEAWLADL